VRVDRRRALTAVCLCAAWYPVCAAYVPVFASRAGSDWSVEWIDIEDESDLIGDYEVEQFPTLLVFDAERIYFASPLRPDASTLGRVLASCEQRSHDQGAGLELPDATRGLVRRILARECMDPTERGSIDRGLESGSL
jgi:thioredoxin 1